MKRKRLFYISNCIESQANSTCFVLCKKNFRYLDPDAYSTGGDVFLYFTILTIALSI